MKLLYCLIAYGNHMHKEYLRVYSQISCMQTPLGPHSSARLGEMSAYRWCPLTDT